MRLLGVMVLMLASGCENAPHQASLPPEAPPAGAFAPVDGAPLFAFLLREIPDLVNRVHCSCCGRRLAECYHGACPTSCGPCNHIGRDVFSWHAAGLGDDEVAARAQRKYGVQ
jgi:hypothetical protein